MEGLIDNVLDLARGRLGGGISVSDFGLAGVCVCAAADIAAITVAASIELATSSMSRRLIVA